MVGNADESVTDRQGIPVAQRRQLIAWDVNRCESQECEDNPLSIESRSDGSVSTGCMPSLRDSVQIDGLKTLGLTSTHVPGYQLSSPCDSLFDVSSHS